MTKHLHRDARPSSGARHDADDVADILAEAPWGVSTSAVQCASVTPSPAQGTHEDSSSPSPPVVGVSNTDRTSTFSCHTTSISPYRLRLSGGWRGVGTASSSYLARAWSRLLQPVRSDFARAQRLAILAEASDFTLAPCLPRLLRLPLLRCCRLFMRQHLGLGPRPGSP